MRELASGKAQQQEEEDDSSLPSGPGHDFRTCYASIAVRLFAL